MVEKVTYNSHGEAWSGNIMLWGCFSSEKTVKIYRDTYRTTPGGKPNRGCKALRIEKRLTLQLNNHPKHVATSIDLY